MGTYIENLLNHHRCYSYQLDGKKKVIQGKKNGLYGLGDITEKYKRSLLKQFNEEYENNKYNHYGEKYQRLKVLMKS